ncbi:MAG: phosphatase PAP2 family protein [Lysobacterales bacterium]
MKPWLIRCLACWFAFAAGTSAAGADDSFGPPPTPATTARAEPESPLSVDYLKLLWADAGETVTEPLRWDRDDWRDAGLIGGGLLIAGAFLDKPIRDEAQRGRSRGSDAFFRRVERFGTKQYGLPVLAGFYVYGAAADDYEAKAVALDGFSADVISALVTSTIKGIVGRARPNAGLGTHHFQPLQGDYSFPSGHATGAFAFASVIAAHYDSPWVGATAYGIAGLVGVARVRLDAHWATDVVAGGLIGGLIGHHLVQFNRELRARGVAMAPTIGSDGNELTLTWDF